MFINFTSLYIKSQVSFFNELYFLNQQKLFFSNVSWNRKLFMTKFWRIQLKIITAFTTYQWWKKPWVGLDLSLKIFWKILKFVCEILLPMRFLKSLFKGF